ncbi:hypothetical protein HNQ93_001758 [Hymenobacter luteus]|uniref:Uncharacterized protein n=2 Tax=Hymenobacter TaxID=89966 RepID=A0A7W9WCQ8_9BACT|nr:MULTISPECIES: hypothetical protein [Hymenobacter]MBB4600881.1 hypothetical protein [Hymenobacter latericoloratus]MBB6058912.1 hypothetical protein [Hymenobacter luteus]
MKHPTRFRQWHKHGTKGQMISDLKVGDTIATANGQQAVTLPDLKSTAFKQVHCLMLASGTQDMTGQEIYETDVVQVFWQPGATGPSYFAYVFFDPARGFVLRNAQDVPLAAVPYKRIWANFYAEPHWRRQFEHHARFIEDHWA